MNIIIDVCMMINHHRETIAWLEYVDRSHHKLVDDGSDGPCWGEILHHSPTQKGAALRAAAPHRSPVCIPARVYERYLRLKAKNSKRYAVRHNGDPAGQLKTELLGVVEVKQLQKWWSSDRKWVAMAQAAYAADIYSTDGGFAHCKEILGRHGITVKNAYPPLD